MKEPVPSVTSVHPETLPNAETTLPLRRRLLMRGAILLGLMPLLAACHDDDDDDPKGGGKGGGGASDARLKERVRRIGTSHVGLPLYEFSYTGRAERYVGVMAQDVLKVRPEAVSTSANGFMAVNYRMLGLRMLRVA
jgi:hypothetical protein